MLKVGGQGDVKGKGKVLLLCIIVTLSSCIVVVSLSPCHHMSLSSCPCVSSSHVLVASCLGHILVLCPHCHPVSMSPCGARSSSSCVSVRWVGMNVGQGRLTVVCKINNDE